ncbi:DUF298-domain-containing protein [Gloeopeniophorella convolvens]|nr:DUF298-domain-containing protein [Gloeopeniophorella convolvens]
MPLLLAWQLDSHEMGKISKEEWMKGTDALRVASLSVLANILEDLNNLVVLGQPPAQAAKTQKGSSYDRARYGSYAADSRKAFLSFYSFCFALAKPDSRNIDMETACALWSVVLAPQFPLIADVIEFINANGSYKGVNKDLWSMMLEFCRDTQPDLSDFEADGAWPSIIDDFVTWKRAQADNEPVEAAADGA